MFAYTSNKKSMKLENQIQGTQPVNTTMQTSLVQTWDYLTCAQKPTIKTGHANFGLINHIIRIRVIILNSNNSEIFTTRINKMYWKVDYVNLTYHKIIITFSGHFEFCLYTRMYRIKQNPVISIRRKYIDKC